MGASKSKREPKYNEFSSFKVAKYSELAEWEKNKGFPKDKLKEYVGYGNNASEALEELRKECNKYGIPEPKNYSDSFSDFSSLDYNKEEDKYHCGYVTICYLTCNKRRINPVFIRCRNGVWSASTFYNI